MLAGASPLRSNDGDRLRLPAAPPPRSSKAEKNESAAHHNQLCPPHVTPFSHCSPGRRRYAVHTAENEYAGGGVLRKKAKSSAGGLVPSPPHATEFCVRAFSSGAQGPAPQPPRVTTGQSANACLAPPPGGARHNDRTASG